KPLLKSVNNAKWALFAPIIVLGGIYGGIFTPTEAAVVSVVYCFIIGYFVYKDLTLKKVYDALLETLIVNGVTTYMIGLSMAFAYYLTIEQIPLQLTEIITGV